MKKNLIKVSIVCLSILFSLICVDHFTCVEAYCKNRIEGYWDPSGQYHEYPPEEEKTPKEAFDMLEKTFREKGWSEKDIQELMQGWRSELDLDSSTPSAGSSGTSSSSTQAPAKATPSYTEEQIEAAWEEAERVEATCVEEGSISYKNSLTGKTKIETIPATGLHTYEVKEHVDATCVAEGHETHTCSVCGETQKDVISALGHKEGNPAVTKKAGWFSEGELTVCCEVCGAVLSTEVIPQTCPLAFWQVIAIVLGIVAVTFTVIMVALKNRAKVCLQ